MDSADAVKIEHMIGTPGGFIIFTGTLSQLLLLSEYMAPEVMNCLVAGPASDMWSVGVVSYMLLAGGKSPFYSGSR